MTEGGFAGAVGSHQYVGLAGADLKTDLMKKLSLFDGGGQVLYLQ
jgi:hypothetical protein